jgi:uncharacterized protein YciI
MRYAVHALDKPDSLAIRQANRADHLDYLTRFETPLFGPLLDEAGNMCGSLIIFEAASQAEVESILADDPYNRAGLFEQVSVREFKTVGWPA